MSFLYPSFLFGLALVAIPVIIHYFNFQRAKKVQFTNVAFLKNVKQTTTSRNQLRHLLVMLLRMLFIACLILAFAKPFFPSSAEQSTTGSPHVSVFVDNSYSSQQEINGQKVLDLIRASALKLPEVYPQNTLYQLLDNQFSVRSRFFNNGEKFSDQVSELDFSNASRPLSTAYSRQAEALSSNAPLQGNHIFWFSDFQKTTIGALQDLNIDTVNSYYLVPFHRDDKTNIYIDSVWITTPFIKPQENHPLFIRLQNDGDEKIDNFTVKLFLDEQQVSVGTVNILPNSSETFSLSFSVSEKGIKKGRVSIEDYPLVFDNDYFFTLQSAPTIRICYLHESEQNFIPKVFQGEDYFSVSSFSTDAIDYNTLKKSDLILLENIDDMDVALLAAINEAWELGASVAIFPSEKTDAETLGSSLGIRLSMPEPSADQEKAFQALAVPSTSEPFFENVFEKVDEAMSMPTASPLLSWGSQLESVVQFRSGKAFMGRRRMGSGNLYLFSSPLSPKFTSLPRHALFVPIMLRMAILSKQASGQLAYQFGQQQAKIVVDSIGKGEVFKLNINGKEMIPEQKVSGNDLYISVSSEEREAGVFPVISTADNRNVGMLAFNYNHLESRLESYTAEELHELFAGRNNVEILAEVTPDRFKRTLTDQQAPRSLWKWFVWAALLFLSFEVLVVRFWKS